MNTYQSTEKSEPFVQLPGGVPSMMDALPGRSLERGQGGRCWDQYGKEFIDFVCGYGTLTLGHCNDEVREVVIQQLDQGMMFPSATRRHSELTAALRRIFSYAERAIILKTGSEAVSAALRLARAFTGKSKIIRCGYHGWHDPVVSPHVLWHLYDLDSMPPRTVAGVIPAWPEPLVICWNGAEIDELESLLRKHRGEVAALILDPVQLREPMNTHLQELRFLTQREETLLVLDEAKTGFRVSLAGVQGLYGVQADLTVLSKGLSNGFPLAAVVGPAEIMDLATEARIMGTYNNELLSMAAALTTISILERPDSIPHLWQVGQLLIDGINEILDRHSLLEDVRAIPYRWPCMPFIWFCNHSEAFMNLKSVFYRRLVQEGVLLLANHMSFSCLAHTRVDVERALQVMANVLPISLREAGIT